MIKANPSTNFFDDEDFQDHLVALLCQDVKSLQECGPLLHPDDFKPLRGHRHGQNRWITAERALEYYSKYHTPIQKLLRADLLEQSQQMGLGTKQVQELLEYLDYLHGLKNNGAEGIVQKVVRFKREKLKALALQDMIDLQAGGELSDAKWQEISQKVLATPSDTFLVSNYFDGLKDRETRRRLYAASDASRAPMLLIEPLDSMVRGIGAGHLGVAIAPTARGKSLFLSWVTLAYALQRLNVLLVTLEDPKPDAEDRLDAAVSGIPIHRLIDKPRLMRTRFQRFRRMIRSQVRILDGTHGGMTVPKIEQLLLRERDHGFTADALIIDYDDEIEPVVKHKERRFEFADIYRSLRQVAARHNLIVWTAAQTQRGTENMKILSGDRVAEDISKIRKVTMAISLGQGDWSDDSIYLWVAKHRLDKQHVGCHIIPDKKRMMIYDRDATHRAEREHQDNLESDAE